MCQVATRDTKMNKMLGNRAQGTGKIKVYIKCYRSPGKVRVQSSLLIFKLTLQL